MINYTKTFIAIRKKNASRVLFSTRNNYLQFFALEPLQFLLDLASFPASQFFALEAFSLDASEFALHFFDAFFFPNIVYLPFPKDVSLLLIFCFKIRKIYIDFQENKDRLRHNQR